MFNNFDASDAHIEVVFAPNIALIIKNHLAFK